MRYISTRGGIDPIPFTRAVMMGLADDGGLLVPERIPEIGPHLDSWGDRSYPELAAAVLAPFVDDIPPDELERLVRSSYEEAFPGEVAPVVPVGALHVLELWHGPTLAFKDVALQFLGRLFEWILARDGGELNILGATSGDTGSAAIAGVRGRDRMRIFVMHPAGRVSSLQERQMTTVLDRNVFNMAVEGSFDDCQRILKELAGDLPFKSRYALGAVNSVNWARVLAQIVYYVHAFLRVKAQTGASSIQVAVPTGNFGDILAGWYAREMGVPIERLILATNENDILTRFFQGGTYSRGEVHHTLAPSMDIQVASNFERYLFELVDRDATRLGDLMRAFDTTSSLSVDAELVDPARGIVAGRADRDQVLATIRETQADHGYVLDPHTAVGVSVATRQEPCAAPLVCLATAHPAKFPDAVKDATEGAVEPTHPILEALKKGRTRCTQLAPRTESVRQYMKQVLD